MEEFKKTLTRKKGFTLIGVVLLILSIGIIAFMAGAVGVKLQTIVKERETVKRMVVVRDALKDYYRGHQELPEPTGNNEVPVGISALNLEQKYRLDTWGQRFHYNRVTKTAADGSTITDIRGVIVNGVAVAGVIVSGGSNQVIENSTWDGISTTYNQSGDDIIVPVNVQAQAIDNTVEELNVLASKHCAYYIAHNNWNLGLNGYVSRAFVNSFGLNDYYTLDPWGNYYIWDPLWNPGNYFVSTGPNGSGNDSDDIYSPNLDTCISASPLSPPPAPPTSFLTFDNYFHPSSSGWIFWETPSSSPPTIATTLYGGIYIVTGVDGKKAIHISPTGILNRGGLRVWRNINPDNMPQLTITAWVKPDTIPYTGNAMIVSADNRIPPRFDRALGIADKNNDSTYGFAVGTGPGGGHYQGDGSISGSGPNGFDHVAVVYNRTGTGTDYSGTVTLYVNGVRVGAVDGIYADPRNGTCFFFSIGARWSFGGLLVDMVFNGAIDDVAIYDYLLTDANIQWLCHHPGSFY